MGALKEIKSLNSGLVFALENPEEKELTLAIAELKEDMKKQNIFKARIVLTPNIHAPMQKSILIASPEANFRQRKFPFLPWMECSTMDGELALHQYYEKEKETTFLKSSDGVHRFDPSVFHQYEVKSELAVFLVTGLGPYLENLIEKK